jgi:hypothetical protein
VPPPPTDSFFRPVAVAVQCCCCCCCFPPAKRSFITNAHKNLSGDQIYGAFSAAVALKMQLPPLELTFQLDTHSEDMAIYMGRKLIADTCRRYMDL